MHPFTKQRIVWESGIGGERERERVEGGYKATQGTPKWLTLDQTKASFTEPVKKENRKLRITPLSLSHLLFPLATSIRESTITRARQT